MNLFKPSLSTKHRICIQSHLKEKKKKLKNGGGEPGRQRKQPNEYSHEHKNILSDIYRELKKNLGSNHNKSIKQI